MMKGGLGNLMKQAQQMQERMQQMQEGGEYTLYIPAELGYGAEPPQGAPIPPNADLIFDIEVVDIMSNETYERNMVIIQQMMAGPGGPGGPGGPDGAGAPPPGPPPGL